MKTEQTNTPDPQLRQQLRAFSKKVSEAWNNNDAAALAAHFTEDAVLLEDTGPIYGREAIEKHYKYSPQRRVAKDGLEHLCGHTSEHRIPQLIARSKSPTRRSTVPIH
jgi:SnoaL-like protein